MSLISYNIIQGSLFFFLLVLCYQLYFKKYKSLNWHRLILIVLPVVSFSLPWLGQLFDHSEVQSANYIFNLAPIVVTPASVASGTETSFSLWNTILLIWGIGIAGYLSYTTFQYFIILRKIPKNAKRLHNNVVIHYSEETEAWSFFNHVVIPASYKDDRAEMVLLHEMTHVHQKHSWDLLWAELISSILWWHPGTFIWKRIIKENHEYLADEAVVQQYSFDNYGKLLLNNAFQIQNFKWTNTFFNKSNLKRRIKMMNNQKQIKRWIPIAGIITITGVLMAFSSQQSPSKTDKIDAATTSMETTTDSVYDKVDKMPEFPGGQKEMMKYLGSKIVYPKDAMDKEIEGKTFISFVVDKSGKIRDVNVMKTDHEIFNDPSVKVIKKMPNWTPGEKDGKKVNVKIVLPIVYKLPD